MTIGLVERRLTTSPDAEAAYRAGLDAFLQLRSGALEHFARALALDPTFALAHSALALIGHELCAPVDVAHRAKSGVLLSRRATEAERSHASAVAGHVAGDRRAVVRHLEAHPDDAMLLSVAVPTIAFAGLTEVPQDAWAIVESCTGAQGGTWFHNGLLAFVRQEQGRWDEAFDLATASLTEKPGSGHAAHARAHVHYETADHAAGLSWIDAWIAGDGAATDNLAHYSWHAALHELSTGDLTAVRDRFERQLSAPRVEGCRALVDSASLLWRWQITPGAVEVPSVSEVDVPGDTLLRPANAFVGLHAAVALCAADDAAGLRSLACWATSSEDAVLREVVAPLAFALRLMVLDQPGACADALLRMLPKIHRVGGSDAQREVIEETALAALLRAGRFDDARRVIDARLDRRVCRRDLWFRQSVPN